MGTKSGVDQTLVRVRHARKRWPWSFGYGNCGECASGENAL